MKTSNKSVSAKKESSTFKSGNIILLLIFIALMLVTAWTETQFRSQILPTTQLSQRPANWAQKLEKPGLENFYKVNENLYRGARPTVEGFKSLQELGIKTIVNFEAFHTDEDEIAESDTTFNYIQIRMTAWNISDENMLEFLKIATDPTNYPIFVHCQHGSDRTGVAIAMYRIFVEGWSKEAAIDELKNGGYGFHFVWQNIVEYLRELDVGKFKYSIVINGM